MTTSERRSSDRTTDFGLAPGYGSRMGLFSSKAADVKAASAAGHAKHHDDMADFHTREAVKYEARAAEREAAGDLKGAARSRKVAERNRRKAGGHGG